ncbi:ATP-binding cassette domain-containing protein, partial [Corynebacterium pyruviciproducens]|uniref:ATP-binding cassette domain-containing protein n=1 Tax=Corynebacterium pyruviciproducens TaxID=598660 RepID=UPI0023F329AA
MEATSNATPLLQVNNLKVEFESTTGVVEAVRDFDLTIYPGQSVAIVGESGSGKSTAAMSFLGLLPGTGKVSDGSIRFESKELTGLTDKQWQEYRGSQI